MLKSKIVKRSIAIAGHRTSISVEDEFWNALKEIARRRHMTLGGIVGRINENDNSATCRRLFVSLCWASIAIRPHSGRS
jgi:predicted DNA-binding ribbon-helix-helix protein